MSHRVTALAVVAAAVTVGAARSASAGVATTKQDKAAAPVISPLALDPHALDATGMAKLRVGYIPTEVPLTTTRPASITKEPAYTGKPWYGTFRLGNGPQATYVLAIDAPASGPYRIFIDKNRNGDLTDDGDGAWTSKKDSPRATVYGINNYVLRASWGTDTAESSSGDYGVGLYCFATSEQPHLFLFREAARTGTMTLGGKTQRVLLLENDDDALFDKAIATGDDGRATGSVTTRPVMLVVLPEGSGGKPVIVDVRGPFELAGGRYEAKVSMDGAHVVLTPTTRAVADLSPKEPPTLAAGTVAPDFSVQTPTGSTVKLSDFKGKVVILDFWATWCGPCQASMPHLEKVWRSVKDQDVAVLGVCVWDEKKAFDGWVPANKSKYTFPVAFDPAGQDNAKSVASKLYSVSGIPTTYLIDKDGKVVTAVVGYDENDKRIEEALAKLGVKIASAK